MISVGSVVCVAAIAGRFLISKPVDGMWLGYTYHKHDGELVKDEEAGEYLIRLNKDGTYQENSNATSGNWTMSGNVITLKPVTFYDMTPEEHRQRIIKEKGKESKTMEMLLETRMKPILITYSSFADKLIYDEPEASYIYDRMN